MNTQIKCKVEHLMCAHCATTVEVALKKIGIDAKVNLSDNTVKFSYDDEVINLSYIERVVSQQGYKLVIDTSKKNYFSLLSIVTSIIVLVVAVLGMINMVLMPRGIHINFFMFFDSNLIKLIFSTLALIILGIPFIYRSIKAMKTLMFGMDFLIALGSLSSYILSVVLLGLNPNNFLNVFKMGTMTYFDATMMILSIIYLGHLITEFVKKKSSSTLSNIEKLIPTEAIKIEEGVEIKVDVDSLVEGDVVLVNAGSMIPADSVVVSGTGSVDEKVLTGEYYPREVKEGDEVFLSTSLVTGPIQCRLVKSASDSLMSSIVNESYVLDNKRGNLSRLSDKIASIFVPIIVCISIIAFFINFFVIYADKAYFERVSPSVISAITVLVISCPCAFGLAVPLSSLNGFYLALKNGILFKTGNTFEEIRKIKTIFFDKTGTLTSGELEIINCTLSPRDLLLVQKIETKSNHPIAKRIVAYPNDYKEDIAIDLESVKEEVGLGLIYQNYKIGNLSLIDDNTNISNKDKEILNNQYRGTIVVFKKDNDVLGLIELKDQPLSDAKETIEDLHKLDIKTVMISGDNKLYTENVGTSLGFELENIHSEVLPSEKRNIIEKEINGDESYRQHTCYIGDGVNDILALSSTALRIASNLASEVTKEKANCLLLKQKLDLIVASLAISRKVFVNIVENFIWAILYNAILIPFAILGDINPTLASVLMIVSSLTLIVNASRIRLFNFEKVKKKNKLKNLSSYL